MTPACRLLRNGWHFWILHRQGGHHEPATLARALADCPANRVCRAFLLTNIDTFVYTYRPTRRYQRKHHEKPAENDAGKSRLTPNVGGVGYATPPEQTSITAPPNERNRTDDCDP